MTFRSENWIAEGMLSGLRNTFDGEGRATGFCFDLRNQTFHGSHPLGWIRALSVDVDGRKLPRESLTFVLREQRVPCALLPEIADVWWQPREVAVIDAALEGGLQAGAHKIGCDFVVSTNVFTPSIDRADALPTMPDRVEAVMELVHNKEKKKP